jgi:Domain of unknown function (DUF4296)
MIRCGALVGKWRGVLNPILQAGIYLCTLCFLSACGEKKEEPLTLPDDKMVKILVDAHIMESALQDVNFRLRDSVKVVFYNQVYEMNGITEAEFVENIEIMNKQPKLMSRVYSKVMEELSKLEVSD